MTSGVNVDQDTMHGVVSFQALSNFVEVQTITWGTTEEAAHAVASLENILWLGKQLATAAQRLLPAVLCGVLITSQFQRDVLPRVVFLSASNRFELFHLCCRVFS